jgi:hypothetical protein
MLPPVRDSYIHNLAAWRFIRDKSPQEPQIQNIATEFGGADAPKSRFLFTVSFELDAGLGIDLGHMDLDKNRYSCKSATRPSQTIEYQDVNSYNYRFKVATKVDNGSATVVFYDDNKNTVLNIIRNYMLTVSPIARRESGPSYYNQQEDVQMWAGIGPLANNSPDGILKTLTVSHHYNSNYTAEDNAHQIVHYDYINPKLQNFIMEDLDMSTSEASMITLTFVYDSVNIWYSDSSTETYNKGGENVGRLDPVEIVAP